MLTLDWLLVEAILAEEPGLLAAWVFGSAREGHVSPGSDLDLGLWYEAEPPFAQLLALDLALGRALNLDAIDLVVLNEAHPILRFEAVSGRLVFCRDREDMAGFVSLTAREYEDVMGLLRKALRYRETA